MDGWKDGRTDGRADEWTDGWLEGQMNNARMETCIHANILRFLFSVQRLHETYFAPTNLQPVAVELHTTINVCLHV
jgi:hypothetical protein